VKMLELNKIYCMDNIQGIIQLGKETVNLTVTSPPYDNMKNYKGYFFDFERLARGLFWVTKPGGVVVWVVGDGTKDGNESGTSFKQALYFKQIGFNLHDTMIYHKKSVGACGSMFSYNQAFEYMFVFSKGKIKTFNPIKDLIPKNAGQIKDYPVKRSDKDKFITERVRKLVPDGSKRQNVWTYDVGFGSGDDKTGHPAVFPERLAEDHILSWSNADDLVLDPFSGSGTTAKMAKLNNRNFVGFDVSQEYCDIANKRLDGITQ
jgi:site-specific DNA-methyltransferase (adenine-specific)